jgi:predicted DNA-binding transcriptional regulator YafY
MRADRLLSIMLRMQGQGRITARELATQLEVSERTIYRDMEALSMAGIPVMAERGINGGWELLEGYRANLNALNLTEIQSVFLAAPASILNDLGLQTAAENAVLKLLAALPTDYRADAEAMRQRLHIDLTGWTRTKEDVTCLPILQEAVWNARKLTMQYQGQEGNSVERVVDPLGLVAKGSVWYLVGAVEGEIRTYRVSRIGSVSVQDVKATRPAGFDLAAYWSQSTADFKAQLPRYETVVRVSPAILSRLRYAGTFAKIEHVSPPEADGWCVARICFDVPDEAREYVLGFGIHIEVIEPAELRQAVIEMAQAVIAFYEQNVSTPSA